MKEPILLHSCCAPCSSAILEWLLQNDYAPHVYYFNPNIFPEEEYLVRKNECIRYCEKLAVPFTDGDWDHAGWRNAVKGHECDPERGERCRLCFGVRMRATAAMAAKLGIRRFTTTLAGSRWKRLDQIREAALEAAPRHHLLGSELAQGRSAGAQGRDPQRGKLLQPALVRLRILHGTSSRTRSLRPSRPHEALS